MIRVSPQGDEAMLSSYERCLPFGSSVGKTMTGPLAGLKVLEMAGLGPAPFATMMLADMGAEVLCVDRPGAGAQVTGDPTRDLLRRSRRSVVVDLKKEGAAGLILSLCEQADVLIEGFRPGVMERAGLGPDVCLARNPRLIYGRMTGWGRDGPLARAAGHDINYIALAGVLNAIGAADGPPLPPLNLVGDYGGGGMLLAFGVLCALFERQRSNRGQVVDAAMIDGAALMMTVVFSLHAMGWWRNARGSNLLDGAAPFYRAYETADGKYVSFGALEPQFYREFLELAGLDEAEYAQSFDPRDWPALAEKLAGVFCTRTRDEWCQLFEGTDACIAPVLAFDEAPAHPQNRARSVHVSVDDVVQPAPAPRFSRTPADTPTPPPAPGTHTQEGLRDWGVDADEIAALRAAGVLVPANS